MSQKLRGLVAQSMSGAKKAFTPVQKSYGPGSYTFTVTTPGIYRFVMWGGGGAGGSTAGGGSGAFILTERALGAGWQIPITVGAGGAGDVSATLHGGPGAATTVTLPDGTIFTAGAGTNGAPTNSPGVGGIATVSRPFPGDIALNGSGGGVNTTPGAAGAGTDGGAGGASGGGSLAGGAGAPGNSGYRGGNGGVGGTLNGGQAPGAGGGFNNTAGVAASQQGGDGLVIITQVRARR